MPVRVLFTTFSLKSFFPLISCCVFTTDIYFLCLVIRQLIFAAESLLYFQECIDKDPEQSEPVSAIRTLLEVIRKTEGK